MMLHGEKKDEQRDCLRLDQILGMRASANPGQKNITAIQKIGSA
jgi:hypothetical protein